MSSRIARASGGTKRKPRFSRCRFSRVEQDRFGICPALPVARYMGQMLKLSWICFTLAEFRLRSFAPTGSICSLSGFHFVQPYANPQVQHDNMVLSLSGRSKPKLLSLNFHPGRFVDAAQRPAQPALPPVHNNTFLDLFITMSIVEN